MKEPIGESRETILVVDDNVAVLGLVVAVLATAKFHVLQATSGAEAIERSDNHSGNLNLLVADVRMPGMSGPELGDVLTRSRPDLRVILMSGMVGGDELIMRNGWAFIQKPFAPAALLEMIHEILSLSDQAQSNEQHGATGQARIAFRP